jgi:hypothetical protein
VKDVRDEAWVRSQAMGALSGWLPGYTEPADDTDEVQYKIEDVSKHDDDVMTISVESADPYWPSSAGPIRYFTVDVVVQEVQP